MVTLANTNLAALSRVSGGHSRPHCFSFSLCSSCFARACVWTKQTKQHETIPSGSWSCVFAADMFAVGLLRPPATLTLVWAENSPLIDYWIKFLAFPGKTFYLYERKTVVSARNKLYFYSLSNGILARPKNRWNGQAGKKFPRGIDGMLCNVTSIKPRH